jgi:RIO kinase 2
MKALYNVGYPTPEPVGHNRHVVVMSLVRGVPLYQVSSRHLSSDQAASIFRQASNLALRLARHGLVHCDLNEFNLLVDLSGIQQKSLSEEHDPYVRHSGMSVAAESTPGMLSARGIWEPKHLKQFQPDHHPDDTGSNNDEEPPQPLELLDNGEAKPIVTLIDFPQMVSTQHANAKDLYERDTACLYKFFTHKLQFHIPESEREGLFLTWESVQKVLKEQQQQGLVVSEEESTKVDGSESACLASKAQLRLDHELKASGYSEEDSNRDLDLYYYRSKNEADSDSDHGNCNGQGEGAHDDNNDNGSIESEDDVEAPNVPRSASVVSTGQLADRTREQLQEQARERVQQQLDNQKKKEKQRGAFQKRNSNKKFLKGKRVFDEFS